MIDSGNPSVGLDEAVTFAVPTATPKESSNVAPNYVDKVTAGEFPVGDTVTAQECDGAVTSANLATHCDTATQITGTVAANGKVTFTATGVKVLVGSAFSDTAGGSVSHRPTSSSTIRPKRCLHSDPGLVVTVTVEAPKLHPVCQRSGPFGPRPLAAANGNSFPTTVSAHMTSRTTSSVH